MQNLQRNFFDFVITTGALCFGEFTLKSGRRSAYFFNAGLFNCGTSLQLLGEFYARIIVGRGIEFDMLFGPSYKGIPLVAATAIALSGLYRRNIPFAFDRKEVKGHGEGGKLVGAPLHGKVLIIDDVITAGISVGYSVELIREHQAECAGLLVALDREEPGIDSSQNAADEIRSRLQIPFYAIAGRSQLLRYMQEKPELRSHLPSMQA
ncbi:MAG TPA: orotate phosphoribosyltransferase [Gammaproteobacteria bacterium]|nr:orotate phosphoribosyltransferase [Gammaproteobacteria bacterium]